MRPTRRKIRPEGTTAAPAWCSWDREKLPAPQENVDILTLIDWPWIASELAVGHVASIAVSPEDVGALIDAVQGRIGLDVVMRWTKDCVLWVALVDRDQCRETAAGGYYDGDEEDDEDEDFGFGDLR